MSVARRAVVAGVAAAAALAAACAEVSTEPSAVVSVAFDTSTVAVVVGDTLRDTLGRVLPLRVAAFNARGDTVRNAEATFVVSPADTGIVRLVGPLAIGGRLSSTAARVFAVVGGLQSLPKSVDVIRAPERLVDSSAADSVRFGAAVVSAKSTRNTQVQVTADSSGTRVGVRRVVVRFTVERAAPTLADSVALVDERTPTATFVPRSPLDTTDASGKAGRQLLVFRRAGATGRDSVVVRAVVAYPGVYRGAAIVRDTVRYKVWVAP